MKLLRVYAFLVCTSIFISPYIVGYYTLPVKIGRVVAAEQHVNLSYKESSGVARAMLREQTGSDGLFAYAIYSERSQLSSNSYHEFVHSQFDDVDDLEGLIGALINIVRHAIRKRDVLAVLIGVAVL